MNDVCVDSKIDEEREKYREALICIVRDLQYVGDGYPATNIRDAHATALNALGWNKRDYKC